MDRLDGTTQTITYLTELKRQLAIKREVAMHSIREIEGRMAKLTAALEILLDQQRQPDNESPRLALLRKLKNMTQPKALEEISSYNGGILIAQEARELMIQAGIMQKSKNSASLIHKVIARTGMFERTGRGKYKYLPDGPLLRLRVREMSSVQEVPQKPMVRESLTTTLDELQKRLQ